MRNPWESSWEMYASSAGVGLPLDHFGPIGWAQQFHAGRRLLRVRIDIVDDPADIADSDYWGWLDLGGREPVHIKATRDEMAKGFQIKGADFPPEEEQERGQGEIVRLRVTVLEEVLTRRTSRHAWRPPTAQKGNDHGEV